MAGCGGEISGRTITSAGRANLGQKALDADHGADLGVEELERDEPLVAQVASKVDGCHSASTNLALELIAPDHRAVESREGVHGLILWSYGIAGQNGARAVTTISR